MNRGTLGKSLLAGILIITAGSHAFAQDGFEIGVGYMIQKSMLINKSDNGQGSRLSRDNTMSYLNGGLVIGYNFNSKIGIEADVMRSRQGQEYTGNNPNAGANTAAYTRDVELQAAFNGDVLAGNYQAKAELNGVKVPVMLKLSTGNSRPLSFHLLLGPQVNVITNVTYELNHKDITLPGAGMTPDDAYRRMTIDGVAAPGITFRVSKHIHLGADVRVDYGFQDVEQKSVTYNMAGVSDNYYGPGRAATHNMTAGVMVKATYRL